jgi:hypothetical protein
VHKIHASRPLSQYQPRFIRLKLAPVYLGMDKNLFNRTVRPYLSGSTGTSDRQEVERYLARKIENIREATIYGNRPRRKFREAATRYLTEFNWKRSIDRDARALKALDPFIGDIWLDCVHNESFKAYIDARHRHPASGGKRITAAYRNWIRPRSNGPYSYCRNGSPRTRKPVLLC